MFNKSLPIVLQIPFNRPTIHSNHSTNHFQSLYKSLPIVLQFTFNHSANHSQSFNKLLPIVQNAVPDRSIFIPNRSQIICIYLKRQAP